MVNHNCGSKAESYELTLKFSCILDGSKAI